MMATTHIYMTLVCAIPIFLTHPEQLDILIPIALISGVVSDFDVLFGQHRKTLHFPKIAPITTFLLIILYYIAIPHQFILYTTLFGIGISIHSISDIFGGGLEQKPWKQQSEKAVYDHLTQQWIAPKNRIAYDGSKGDFVLGVLLFLLTVFIYAEHWYIYLSLLLLTVAGLYTVLRKQLPDIEQKLYNSVPVIRPFLDTLHGPDKK